jgi:hypothetical protein|eukprot:scaffold2715_cov160-Chaetoceros_neogracile.AAC.2
MHRDVQPVASSKNDLGAHQIQINKKELEKQLKHHYDLIDDDYFPTKEEETLFPQTLSFPC